MSQQTQVTIRPENVMPVDSLVNLQQKMLDPRAYGTCAKSVPGVCLGCPVFDRCEFPEKGVGRPKNGGVRVIKSQAAGGGIREIVMPCFHYWQQKDNQESGGNLMEWVAEEGEEITIRVTRPLRADANGVPLPNSPYKDAFDTIAVPEFAGIDKNLKLVNDAYRSEIFKRHHDKKKAEVREQAMAPPAGVTPGVADEKPKRR